MKFTKEHVQGFIIGAILATVATAYAASSMVLVDGDDIELGTTANPLYADAS